MRRYYWVLTAAFIMLASAKEALGACTPADVTSKMQLFKLGSCLRGANIFQGTEYATTGQVWYPIVTQKDLNDLRTSGANVVNYSIPGPYDVSNYARRADYFQRMDDLVAYARNANLFVIMSFRTGPGRPEANVTGGQTEAALYNTAAAQTAFVEMWREVATRYKDHKNIVGYDLLVEPNGISAATWRSIADRTVAAIREVDAQTPILISPHDWGVVGSLGSWTPISGTNLVYTVHQYEPFQYTHSNEPADWSAALESLYQNIRNWQTRYNATIMVNEFGIANHVTNAGQFMAKQIALLESSELNHAAWNWEVEYDPRYTYRVMDFKRYPAISVPIKKSWAANTVYPSNVSFGSPSPSPTPSPTPTPSTPLVISSIATSSISASGATINRATNTTTPPAPSKPDHVKSNAAGLSQL